MPSNLQHGVDEAGLIAVVEYYCEEVSIEARVDADVMGALDYRKPSPFRSWDRYNHQCHRMRAVGR